MAVGLNKTMIYTILFPVLAGILVKLIPFKKRVHMEVFLETCVLLNSILVWYLLFKGSSDVFTFMSFPGGLSIAFKIDGLTTIFAGLISFLWPLATLYSFEYMKKEQSEARFFMFYTITYGVTLGIAMAENIMTMYVFYEMLTLVTVPLIMHTLKRQAILASRQYLYYALGGAAFAFIGMVFVIVYSASPSFLYGRMLDIVASDPSMHNALLFVYVMSFMGFGVKAAICPFNSWLPAAGVAPTPVTALLHAVAVVNSGAFAIIRLTYYSYGADFIKGTWAQYFLMAVVIFTIVYGCSRAVKETHIKRRLAYSTISNLSYILFGVLLLSPLGFTGALCHFVFHAFMKISSFFCAGAITYETDKKYVHELDGLGKSMPIVFTIFTISALALMGVPGLSGFVSKWYLCSAAANSGNVLAYVGIGTLLISALLTAIYMLSIVVRAFFPGRDFDSASVEKYSDPGFQMIVPLVIFTVIIFIFGLHSEPIVNYFFEVAEGLF